MFIDLTPEQRALRLEIRDYFTQLMTPELRLALRGEEGGDTFRKVVKQMGKDGWLAVGWPKEHGGQGYQATEQLIFFEEANIAGAPLPFVTISTVGPALMESGTQLQKTCFCPVLPVVIFILRLVIQSQMQVLIWRHSRLKQH